MLLTRPVSDAEDVKGWTRTGRVRLVADGGGLENR
jgi:hypothetical protein